MQSLHQAGDAGRTCAGHFRNIDENDLFTAIQPAAELGGHRIAQRQSRMRVKNRADRMHIRTDCDIILHRHAGRDTQVRKLLAQRIGLR